MTDPTVGGRVDADQFHLAARQFLSDLSRRDPDRSAFVWGEGDDRAVAIWDDADPHADPGAEARQLDASRRWRRARFDAGFGWIDGPPQLGGRGLPPEFQAAYDRLEREFVVPTQAFFKLDRVLAPILQRYGSPEVVRSYVSALFRGDVIGCELLSEPSAGSDLSALRTTARWREDRWVVTGQKVWTSDAHYADVGLALCRTETGVAGRAGLTAFLLDMHAPGVEVRPLRQMSGGSSFNEVFLTEVTVAESHRLGERGQGWQVIQETLALERAAIGLGLGRGGAGVANGERLVALVEHLGKAGDVPTRRRLAQVYATFRTAKYLELVSAARHRADQSTPPALLVKIALSANLRMAAEFVTDALGPRIAADTGEWGTFAWNSFVLGEPGMHIMAGTDEVVRTAIAEHALGLPREPRGSSANAPVTGSDGTGTPESRPEQTGKEDAP
jgi:alkylation response protein AidB-like acyl-CoA dehydrogenase